ncbi:hypothetical protein DL765_009287 [Monosporascus sp. GIB2]|nr:hypothetical protein DL765_009287 [Monosporascus sp. GIB2]
MLEASAAAINGPQISHAHSSLDLASRSAPVDIEPRQFFSPTVERRLAFAYIFGYLPNFAWTWYSTQKACNEANDAKKGADKVGKSPECTITVLAHLWNHAFGIVGLIGSVGTIAKTWNSPTRRSDDWLIERDVAPALSEATGVEVKHLGYWSDPERIRRRGDDGEADDGPTPVFGANLDGINVHFSYRGLDEDGKSHSFRYGFGNGTQPAGRSLEAREEPWFFEGGIDYKVHHLLLPGERIQPSDEVFKVILDQLTCNFHNNWAFNHWETNRLWVQVYDNVGQGTVMAGVAAPFGPDGNSPVGTLDPNHLEDYIQGIDMDYKCLTPFGYPPLGVFKN